ncbi:hypothetical protein ZOSMA_190G00090 [Zostera marina]|uniref:Uncharacterized protein n=1 Tax=Zostera marina TaxID=29655 RepID=A0A0K9PPL7_ZOSMR|nr:hypothetical protein ZOSMA_190G00090 [Zostera marina]
MDSTQDQELLTCDLKNRKKAKKTQVANLIGRSYNGNPKSQTPITQIVTESRKSQTVKISNLEISEDDRADCKDLTEDDRTEQSWKKTIAEVAGDRGRIVFGNRREISVNFGRKKTKSI